jgi:hypothetical protein
LGRACEVKSQKEEGKRFFSVQYSVQSV